MHTPKHTLFSDIAKDEKAGGDNTPDTSGTPNSGYMGRLIKRTHLSK
jgi:hypothetical protein